MSVFQCNIPFAPVFSTDPRFKNLTGRKFNRWLVLGIHGRITYSYSRPKHTYYWLCKCDCGTIAAVGGGDLTSNHSTSCGCWSRERASEGNATHGESKTPEYKSYCGAKSRCNNPANPAYSRYGGRGIEFRFDSYEDFLAEVGYKPTPKHSLDRIDVNGHYEPGNVRWANDHEQAANTRANHLLTFQGQTMCVQEWARHLNISDKTLHNRLHVAKWSVERALSTPVRQMRPYVRSKR